MASGAFLGEAIRLGILFVAPRQSGLAKLTVSDNHAHTRPLLLILIDAPFSPRLSRHRQGGAFQRVQAPPGQTLQPEATGAVMEVTKWLKPSV